MSTSQLINFDGIITVSCVFSESCMLPCQFPFGSEPLIHWMRVSAGDSLVHSYYKDKDQLGYQLENFKNRTSLFQDQISRGNASLLLRGVKVQDEGKYKCYITLLDAINFLPVFDGIYPKPKLTWSTDPPSNTALPITTTVQQTEEKLYSISSSLVVSDNDPYLTYFEDEIKDAPVVKRCRRVQTNLNEIDKDSGNRIFSATWESKTGVSGQWFFRASLKKAQDEAQTVMFMLDYYNSECGVFRTLLSIPFDAWRDKMIGIADRISTLFRDCRNWKDILGVKKALAF
uniref:Ig-like domain-containing protein n=1 Tax=Fundulus heteroclitus TaxID=8078 RepID=A0A3Q2P6R0_FUNHE